MNELLREHFYESFITDTKNNNKNRQLIIFLIMSFSLRWMKNWKEVGKGKVKNFSYLCQGLRQFASFIQITDGRGHGFQFELTRGLTVFFLGSPYQSFQWLELRIVQLKVTQLCSHFRAQNHNKDCLLRPEAEWLLDVAALS